MVKIVLKSYSSVFWRFVHNVLNLMTWEFWRGRREEKDCSLIRNVGYFKSLEKVDLCLNRFFPGFLLKTPGVSVYCVLNDILGKLTFLFIFDCFQKTLYGEIHKPVAFIESTWIFAVWRVKNFHKAPLIIASQYEHHWSVVAILVIVDQTLSDTLTDAGAGAENCPKLCQHGQVKHFGALAIVWDCINLTKKQDDSAMWLWWRLKSYSDLRNS